MHVIEMKKDKETKGIIRYAVSDKADIPDFRTQDDVDATCIYILKDELQMSIWRRLWKNSVPESIIVTIETKDKAWRIITEEIINEYKRSIQDDN